MHLNIKFPYEKKTTVFSMLGNVCNKNLKKKEFFTRKLIYVIEICYIREITFEGYEKKMATNCSSKSTF